MKKAKTKKVAASEPKLVFTRELPKKEGFYWWTCFGEHTPCVMQVKKDYSDGGSLWADNGEYSFKIEKPKKQLELPIEEVDEDEWKETDGKDTYRYGDQLWCYIPNPWLPNGTKQVEPDCY
jgi:hypothetical protein